MLQQDDRSGAHRWEILRAARRSRWRRSSSRTKSSSAPVAERWAYADGLLRSTWRQVARSGARTTSDPTATSKLARSSSHSTRTIAARILAQPHGQATRGKRVAALCGVGCHTIPRSTSSTTAPATPAPGTRTSDSAITNGRRRFSRAMQTPARLCGRSRPHRMICGTTTR